MTRSSTYWKFTLLLAVLALSNLSSADYCPSSVNIQIQECVQPVGDYAKLLNNNQTDDDSTSNARRTPGEFGAFTLPNMGKKVFSDLCKLVTKFNLCITDLRPRCPRHVTIGLIDSSYGYLCNEGFNTFMESAECLMELDRKPQVKECHDETLREIEKANGDVDMGLGPKVERMCSALNFFSSCVKTPIKEECGGPAWRVIFRVLRETTQTLMPNCKFAASSHPSTTPAFVKELFAGGVLDSKDFEASLSEDSSKELRAARLTTSYETSPTTSSPLSLDYVTEESVPSEDSALFGLPTQSEQVASSAANSPPVSSSAFTDYLFSFLLGFLMTIRLFC